MVGTQEHHLFLAKSKILRGREGINLLVHACRSNSLSFFFPSFLIFSFSYLFLFLNPCFLFPSFQVSNTVVLVVVVPVHSKGLFIVPTVIGFYYFGPQQPLSSLVYLSTTTDLSVCHFSSPNKRKLFCLFVCCGTLSCYGLGAFSLPIPHGMYLVDPTQLCFFWVICYPNRTLPPKEPENESQNRSFPSPHH